MKTRSGIMSRPVFHPNSCWKKLSSEAVAAFWKFPNQWDKISDTFILTHKVPGKRFPGLEEPDMKEVFFSYAANLTEEYLQELRVLTEPEDVVERPQLTTNALKTDLHIFLAVDYFMDRCQKFICKLGVHKSSVFPSTTYLHHSNTLTTFSQE
jgi:hypothetical protein